MDPAYTTTDPSGLFVTTSGLALDAWPPTTIEPVAYDPATMSTPWTDPNGVPVAMQADGTITPVAVGSQFIDTSSGLPAGVVNILGSGVQAAGTWLQRLLNPASAAPAVGVPHPSPLANPATLLLLGAAAYFLLRKK